VPVALTQGGIVLMKVVCLVPQMSRCVITEVQKQK